MAGMLRHHLIRPDRLPYGPVSIRLTPAGDIDILVDDTTLDPILLPVMDALGADVLGAISPLDTPLLTPQTVSRVHAVSDVGQGRLVAMEFDRGVLHGFVDKDLVRRAMLPAYGEHVTNILRRFTPPTL